MWKESIVVMNQEEDYWWSTNQLFVELFVCNFTVLVHALIMVFLDRATSILVWTASSWLVQILSFRLRKYVWGLTVLVCSSVQSKDCIYRVLDAVHTKNWGSTHHKSRGWCCYVLARSSMSFGFLCTLSRTNYIYGISHCRTSLQNKHTFCQLLLRLLCIPATGAFATKLIAAK